MQTYWLLIIALFFTQIGSGHAAPAATVLDQLELVGITTFTQSDLEKVLEVSPQEAVDDKKIQQTEKNIRDLYRLHGYEEIKIRSQLYLKNSENVLSIQIAEGLPTRVANVKLKISDPKWQKKLQDLDGKLGFASGDIFDQERLANGYRSLQDALSSEDFIDVKVTEAVVTPVAPKNLKLPPIVMTNTAKWVELEVVVDLGERVSFGFRGNTIFTNTQLSAWIEEQRLLGLSRDYLTRIKTQIEDQYRNLGYDRVLVEPYTFENDQTQKRHVTFIITEGPRVEIETIKFDGNTVFDSDLLHEKFFDLGTLPISRNYYVAKDVEKTAELLIEWIKSQGYLSAKLVNVARTYNEKLKKVSLVIYLYEGEQTIVDLIDFSGLHVFSSEEVKAILATQSGKPLNLYAFSEGIEALKIAYRARGYLDIKVGNEGQSEVIQYRQENRLAEIRLVLEEGIQYRVSDVIISGLVKTRREVVQRELQLKAGDVLEEPKLYQSEAALRRLGIFSGTTLKVEQDPVRVGGKILKIEVEEGSPGLVAGGAGLRNDLGARVFGQIAYSNLWGKNHTISFNATANRRYKDLGGYLCPNDIQRDTEPTKDHCFIEYDLQLSYAWPWVFLGQTTFRPALSFDRNQYKDFDATNRALTLGLEKVLIPSAKLTGVLTYSLEFIEQFNANAANAAVDDQRLRIGAFTPALALDRRDNPLSPTKGTFTTGSFELARPEFLSQRDPAVAYSRLQFRNDVFVPLPRGITYFFSFRTGVAYNLSKPPENDPDNPRYQIPLYKRFTLGGVGSVRGFKEQAISIDDDRAIRGYASYVNYRTQLDFPFAGALQIGPFLDAANLNVDNYSMRSDLRIGVGGGLHYKSPVGPVNFDVGVNVKPKPGEDSYQIHFSIGTI